MLSREFACFSHGLRAGVMSAEFHRNLAAKTAPITNRTGGHSAGRQTIKGELMSVTTTKPAITEPAMIDVETVAALLSVSRRHVYMLTNSGRMPRPRKLGAAVRWERAEVERWIADGCPRVDRPRRA